MLRDFFATKIGMTQAWTKSGKRLAVTRCKADDIVVVTNRAILVSDHTSTSYARKTVQLLEMGYGTKKLKNIDKPIRAKLEKAGVQSGVRSIKGVHVEASAESAALSPGTTVAVESVLAVGDVVQVQGTSKGRGFAGAIKRHGFHGGPATHGQSDRARAVGSIGNRTTPGRVWVGKRMPGHYGDEKKTVTGLVVVHLDPATKEVWLSGPIPGFMSGQVAIRKTGQTKELELDFAASGITIAPKAAPEAASEEQNQEAQEQA